MLALKDRYVCKGSLITSMYISISYHMSTSRAIDLFKIKNTPSQRER